MRSIYTSSGAFPTRIFAEILATAKEWGLTEIELSSDIAADPDNIGIARRARNHFSFLLHNYFPAPADPFVLNLGSTDPDALARSRDHCRRALELSAELHAPLFAAHAGFAANLSPSHLGGKFDMRDAAPRETTYSIFVDSVGELVRHGGRLGVPFLVENNVVTVENIVDGENRFLLLAEPGEILLCARDVGGGFGMLIDTGHLNVTAQSLQIDKAEAMRAVSGITKAYHVSDNDGLRDNNRGFDADAWFLPLMKDNLPVTIEVYRASRLELDNYIRILRETRS